MLAGYVPRIKVNLDGRALFRPDLPEQAEESRAKALFNIHDTIVIGISNTSATIFEKETLMRVVRLSQALNSMPGAVRGSVFSIATIPRVALLRNQLSESALIDPGQTIDNSQIAQIKEEMLLLGLNDGILISPDLKTTAIYTDVEDQADRYQLLEAVRRLIANERGPDRIYFSGTALAQASMGISAARDLLVLVPSVLIVIGTVLFIFFRRLVPALVSLLEIGVALVITAGIMGMSSQPVFVTTLILPAILIAVGVSDDVYALSRTLDRFQRSPGHSPRRLVLAGVLGVADQVRLTATLSVLSLLSFTLSDIQPIRTFGLFGAAAIAVSTFFTFTFVPATLVVLAPLVFQGTSKPSRSAALVLRGAVMGRDSCFAVFAVTVVLVTVSCLFWNRLTVNDSWIRNLPVGSDIRAGDRALNQHLAGTVTLNFLIDVDTPNAFRKPQVLARLSALHDRVTGLSFVGGVHSVYSDIVRMNAVLKQISYSDYWKRLHGKSEFLGRPEVEQGYLLLSSGPQASLDKWLDASGKHARMAVFIRSGDYSRIGAVLRLIESERSNGGLGPLRVSPFGDGWLSYLSVALLVQGQFRSITLAMLCDLLLLVVFFRSLRLAATAMGPVIVSLAVVFGIMGALSVPLAIANSLFVPIAIGIGFDFSVHLTAAYARLESRRRLASEASMEAALATGPAILCSGVSISSGFAILMFSEVPPNAELGWLVVISLILCVVTTLTLVTGLLFRLPSSKKQ
jgi:predicted RND superfamily exporter protein